MIPPNASFKLTTLLKLPMNVCLDVSEPVVFAKLAEVAIPMLERSSLVAPGLMLRSASPAAVMNEL